MMLVASLSYRLNHGRTVVTDDIHGVVSDFLGDFFEYFLDSVAIPALGYGEVNYNGVTFANGMALVVGRYCKGKQKLLAANHHAFVNDKCISFVFKLAACFFVDAEPQSLGPVVYGRICRNVPKHAAHELVQNIQDLNHLSRADRHARVESHT